MSPYASSSYLRLSWVKSIKIQYLTTESKIYHDELLANLILHVFPVDLINVYFEKHPSPVETETEEEVKIRKLQWAYS